ncbi:MAG: glycine--tRNA ligase, partial [Acutalibacteraceae bacterium]|nr:glycine--tRNA ligase [Acutalibacteraceae bacterium]
MDNAKKSMDTIVALAKGRGFVYPGSEIYGGLANSWDYGPLGVELKNNIKKAWLKKFVQESPYNVGLDSAILMNPETWVASGHLGGFSDPLMDCRSCKTRHRADKLIEDYVAENGLSDNPAAMSDEEMMQYIKDKGIACPHCGSHDFTDIRKFNLMFKTFQGVTEDSSSTLYLRPETAQGIFVNFKNIARTTRKKIPFGVAQVGKSFRNEITPGNFIFRIREFEQMELEFFCKPGTDLYWFEYWRGFCKKWLLDLGMTEEHLRLRDHDKDELCFYSKATTDFEFLFPFGWGELWGVADRTDYDLTQHANHSGEAMEYFDPETNEKYIPYVIEPSLGADRVLLAFLCDAYDEEQDEKGDTRVVLRLHPALAPFKAAVLPLSKKLSEKATEVFGDLAKDFMVDFDDAGSIGKRYRRQDEIGTPICITYDF